MTRIQKVPQTGSDGVGISGKACPLASPPLGSAEPFPSSPPPLLRPYQPNPAGCARTPPRLPLRCCAGAAAARPVAGRRSRHWGSSVESQEPFREEARTLGDGGGLHSRIPTFGSLGSFRVRLLVKAREGAVDVKSCEGQSFGNASTWGERRRKPSKLRSRRNHLRPLAHPSRNELGFLNAGAFLLLCGS